MLFLTLIIRRKAVNKISLQNTRNNIPNNPGSESFFWARATAASHRLKYSIISLVNENAWALTRPPAMCPLCQYSCQNDVKWCQDVTWRHDVTPWRHDVTSWRHMTSYVITKRLCLIYTCHSIKKFENHLFQDGHLDLWTMTLTFNLVRDIIKDNVNANF